MSHPAHVAPPTQPVVYPESDGQPIGESDIHIEALSGALTALKHHFDDDPQVYVAGDNMFYFEEGEPSSCVSPDIYVVKGIEKKLRRVYKLWEEKKAPDFVMEISSRATRYRDLGDKRAIYASLGVNEYVLFDPTEDYLKPPLQLYRLGSDGEYQRVLPMADGSFESQALGLSMKVDGYRIRFVDTISGVSLPHDYELPKLVEAEREARLEAEAAKSEAEARASALEAELAQLKASLKG